MLTHGNVYEPTARGKMYTCMCVHVCSCWFLPLIDFSFRLMLYSLSSAHMLWYSISFHSPGYPETHFVDKAGLEFTEILLPLLPSVGIKSMCHHVQLLVYSCWGWLPIILGMWNTSLGILWDHKHVFILIDTYINHLIKYFLPSLSSKGMNLGCTLETEH